MGARRRSDGGGGFAVVFVLFLVVGLIIKYFWWIAGAAALVGAFFAIRAIVRKAEHVGSRRPSVMRNWRDEPSSNIAGR
jgi:hypothetical protein